MRKVMNVTEIKKDIIYIENAFANCAEFITLIENLDNNKEVQSVIPSWSFWEDGGPVRLDPDDPTQWQQVFPPNNECHRGVSKNINWDQSINQENNKWPRVIVDESFSPAHGVAYKAIEMIEPDYKKTLDIWSQKTNNKVPNYITRNYCIRKYKTGASMGNHIDRNVENPVNTMDWSALIYLNDDYDGGELVFIDLDYALKPSAGSIIFFPCTESHRVNEIVSGNKYYIFLFIHTDYGTSTAHGEPYYALNSLIDKHRMLQV